MALNPGEVFIGETCTLTYEAGEAISPGDVVGIDGGTLRRVNSGDGSPNPLGIAGDPAGAESGTDYESGDEVIVHISGGTVLANVASGVSAGEELDASATDGQLAAGAGGFQSFTDEGSVAGLSSNESVPAGFAAVKLP